MANSFRFKQFTIANDRAAMKVGTDGVLLGAWADVSGVSTVLDIGTGTGIIALMIAQRCSGKAHITAIDIDGGAVEEASDNFNNSPWPQALCAREISLQEVAADLQGKGSFDLIVSNPPYFVESLKNPDSRLAFARHTDSLSFNELAEYSLRLLSPAGRLAVIYPPQEAMDFLSEAESFGLHLLKMCRIYTRDPLSASDLPPKRILMEFSRRALAPVFSSLVINSAEYQNLTAEFYL